RAGVRERAAAAGRGDALRAGHRRGGEHGDSRAVREIPHRGGLRGNRRAEHYARASVPALEKAIRRIGLYRGKARNLHAAMQRIAREYQGKLPRTREELYGLPGVGWKTAGVVVNHAFGTPAFPVDTHV